MNIKYGDVAVDVVP